EESEVALDHEPLVLGEAVGGLPQRDVGLHADLGRHPVVVAGGQVLLPRPAVLERQQLVDVGTGVDHPLVGDVDARGAALDLTETGAVDGGHGFLSACSGWGRGHGGGRGRGGDSAGYWQASHSGSSSEQNAASGSISGADPLTGGADGAAAGRGAGPGEGAGEAAGEAAATGATALSRPSVPRGVLFSTCVAPCDRR